MIKFNVIYFYRSCNVTNKEALLFFFVVWQKVDQTISFLGISTKILTPYHVRRVDVLGNLSGWQLPILWLILFFALNNGWVLSPFSNSGYLKTCWFLIFLRFRIYVYWKRFVFHNHDLVLQLFKWQQSAEADHPEKLIFSWFRWILPEYNNRMADNS